MLYVQSFTCNFASENTYIVYNDQRSAWLIDPGNSTAAETAQLTKFITEKNLTIKKILLTHAHIDHVLGVQWAHDTLQLPVLMHAADKPVLEMFQISGMRFGFQLPHIRVEIKYIEEGEKLYLDEEEFQVYHVPGHSPGSIVFHHAKQKLIISGDVLFQGSIGRTDLYQGNYELLLDGIRKKLFTLDPETVVFCGHGQPTKIGFEKDFNPFFK